MWSLPTDVQQFATKAALDGLPTKANLLRWRVGCDSACLHCGVKETLHHTLNNCACLLDAGAYNDHAFFKGWVAFRKMDVFERYFLIFRLYWPTDACQKHCPRHLFKNDEIGQFLVTFGNPLFWELFQFSTYFSGFWVVAHFHDSNQSPQFE